MRQIPFRASIPVPLPFVPENPVQKPGPGKNPNSHGPVCGTSDRSARGYSEKGIREYRGFHIGRHIRGFLIAESHPFRAPWVRWPGNQNVRRHGNYRFFGSQAGVGFFQSSPGVARNQKNTVPYRNRRIGRTAFPTRPTWVRYRGNGSERRVQTGSGLRGIWENLYDRFRRKAFGHPRGHPVFHRDFPGEYAGNYAVVAPESEAGFHFERLVRRNLTAVSTIFPIPSHSKNPNSLACFQRNNEILA